MTRDFRVRTIRVCLTVLMSTSLACSGSSSGSTAPSPLPFIPLTANSVTPNVGFANVGMNVVIEGAGFQSGVTLTFDGAAAAVNRVTPTAIAARAPYHVAGIVDVVVTNPNGQRVTLIRGYTYTDEVVILEASQRVVVSGGPLGVSWIAPIGRSPADWIGLFKAGEPSENYEARWWMYTLGTASGALTLDAPLEPGQYEFRYLPDDDYVEIARSAVMVRGS